MSEPRTRLRGPEDLFVYHLEAAYDMELRLVDALRELSQSATNENLSAGFAVHATETERQVESVAAAFEALGREPTRRDNAVVDGLLADAAAFDAGATDDELRNFRYHATALDIERVEITTYEALLAAAEEADLPAEATAPLEGVLAQERKTLRQLQGLAGRSALATVRDALTDA